MTEVPRTIGRPSIRSLRSHDPGSNTSLPASVADFASLLGADFTATTAPRTGAGRFWTVELGVAELVGILRCLDELAAVYEGSVLDSVVSRYSVELRRRIETARVARFVDGDQ